MLLEWDMIERDIEGKLRQSAENYPVVCMTGPTRCGKDILLKKVFPDYNHVILKNKDDLRWAEEDPRGFIDDIGDYVVIDEPQRAPHLIHYIIERAGLDGEPGKYIVSASENIGNLYSPDALPESKAARLTLMPLSLTEQRMEGYEPETLDEWIFKGSYPSLAVDDVDPLKYCMEEIIPSLCDEFHDGIALWERKKLTAFLKCCAADSGKHINLAGIARKTGIDPRTADDWINWLEYRYIVFRIEPTDRMNIPRSVRTPKLYFCDTGVLCAFLGIKSIDELSKNPLKNVLFENAVISELRKRYYNAGQTPVARFWQNQNDKNRGVSLILEEPSRLCLFNTVPLRTAKPKHVKHINALAALEEELPCVKAVIYDGPGGESIEGVNFISWRNL